MSETYPKFVRDLIEIGSDGEVRIPSSLSDEREAWDLIVSRDGELQAAARSMSEADLRGLIKGLVLYSHARMIGGSVSPVIRLCNLYSVKYSASYDDLCGWVVDNRNNQYEPFGSYTDKGIRTRAMLETYKSQRAEEVARKELELKEANAIRDAEAATAKLANAVRRGDQSAVKALLAKGADHNKALNPPGSLQELALANGRMEMASLLQDLGIP